MSFTTALSEPPTPAGIADSDRRLLADVAAGLSRRPKSIPPKWLYDERGSELFEQITRLPEYYPTEAERGILLANADAIVATAGSDTLVELGAGVSDKTTALLDAIQLARSSPAVSSTTQPTPVRFVPFDISAEAIEVGRARLADRYPDLVIEGVVGDFDTDLDRLPSGGSRLIAFLGGTVGNYGPARRVELLADIAATMGRTDHLLLGVDLVKDPGRLVAAYDDSAGVTAAFNRNVIDVVSRRLGLAVSGDDFRHRAVWNRAERWIEMHLVAKWDLSFTLDGRQIDIAAGEHILTEISAKFTPDRLADDLAAAGLHTVATWSDGDYLISLSGRF